LARQKTADADAFLSYRVLSKEHGLADPLTLLDTNAVVSPQLKAFLVDTEGPARFASLRSTDEVIYRSTLASRWIRKQDSLSAEKTVFYLDELWARGHGDYPARAAAKTSPLWPVARPWLARLDSKLRARGLAAVRALPDPTLLEAFVTESRTKGDDSDLLLLSADLAASRDDAALARLSQALEQGTSSINWQEPQAQTSSESEGGEDGEGEGESRPPAAAPAAAEPSRLVPWLRTFRATKRASVISRAEELLRARVAKDLDAPYPNVATWALAIDLSTTPEAVAQTVAGLELAWARGDSLSEEDRRTLVKLLVPKSPEAVARWIPRLAPADSFAAAKQRAEVFVAKKDFDAARKEWTDARKRLPLSRDEERDAFDAWRKTSGTPTASASPAPWMRALAFWQKKGPALSQWGGELAAHLQKQPYDRLAARVVLRSLAPAPETAVAPALLALQASDEVGAFRIARVELARSPRAAKNALNGGTPRARALAQRSYPRAEIDALLADTARIGAGSGDSALVNSSLAQLEERKALVPGPLREELQALRARFAAPAAGIAPPGLRPRDLTWALYSRVLSVEKVP
ncbi:MAG: hypothetical protein JNK60_09065, partial [Acidobacteria bacterium]|nr:hypothetical protein [Acidobacteriota bacterium]